MANASHAYQIAYHVQLAQTVLLAMLTITMIQISNNVDNNALKDFMEQPQLNKVVLVFHVNNNTAKYVKVLQLVHNVNLLIIYKIQIFVFHHVVQHIMNRLIIR